MGYMGDVFKTRDVLYEIPGGEVVSMRRVRGVYIAGPYLPIHYENNLMMITHMEHTRPTIVDYTQRSVVEIVDDPHDNEGHGSMALCDMDFSNNVQVTYYSMQNRILRLDDNRGTQGNHGHGSMALCDFDLSSNIQILLYTSLNKFVKLDNNEYGSMALCDMDFSTICSHKEYYMKHGFMGHDDCIMIRQLNITKATITDGT